MLTEILLVVIPCLILLLIYGNRKPERFPPGPFSWPVVGNLFQLGSEPYKTLWKMKDKYGDLIGLYFGARRTVVINDIKLMKDAFNMSAFSGRSSVKILMHPKSGVKRGVVMGEGIPWSEQRRFTLRNLRNFGFGKKTMEALIRDEIDELIEGLLETENQPIDTHVRFNVAVINGLWTIVAGERFAHSDPKIKKLVDLLTANMSAVNIVSRILPFPWLGDIAPNFSGQNAYLANVAPVREFLQQSIDEHKKTYQEGELRDLIDCFLKEMYQASESSSFHGIDGEENLQVGIYDLFLGGAETTSTSLSWACFLLSHFPKSQEKLHKSITESIGTTRKPSLADKPNLPYLEAVVMEIMRFSSIAPLGTVHETEEDVEFHGYKIPKGTWIMANQFGMMHDEKTWGDPQNFRPERFLSADEKSVVRHEALIPFSTGKRACLGETLAKDELFLFTAALFQRFRVDFDPNSPVPHLTHSVFKPLLTPPPHKILLRDRYE